MNITPEMRAELLAAGMPEDADWALQAAWVQKVAKEQREATAKSAEDLRVAWDAQEDTVIEDAKRAAAANLPEGVERDLLQAALANRVMISIMSQRIALLENRQKRLMELLERDIAAATQAANMDA